MASDVYLQIDGVNGESNDDKHKGWIEVEAVDLGVIQPTAGTMSTAGGHTIGRAVFDALRITKAVDLASPKLMELAAQGKTIPKAKLEFFRADRSGPLKYYEVTLETCWCPAIENPTVDLASWPISSRCTSPGSLRSTPSRRSVAVPVGTRPAGGTWPRIRPRPDCGPAVAFLSALKQL